MPRSPWPWIDRVGEVARLEPRAGRVVVEEVGVDVERVEEVELERVHEVDPHELAALDPDRLVHVGERDRVDRVDLVRAVEVGVEPVHDHHELVGLRAAVLRVDDERAVEALGDVLGQRRRVAVVEVEPERRGVELVGGRLARARCCRRRCPGTPSLRSRWMPWKCIVCGCVEPFVKWIRSRSPSRARSVGPGHAAVVGPGRVLHAGRHLDLPVLGDDAPTRARRRARVPSSKSRRISCGSKPLAAGRPAHRRRGGRSRGGRRWWRAVRGLGRGASAAVQALVRDQLVQHGERRAGGGRAAEQLAPRDFVLPQLRIGLLKHVLGETKSTLVSDVIATSEYELLTRVRRPGGPLGARQVRRARRRGRRLPPGPGLQRRGGARARAAAATRRSSTTRASCAPTCASCAATTASGSTPRRSATPCSPHAAHLHARARRAVGGRDRSARAPVADRPGRARAGSTRRRPPRSTRSSTRRARPVRAHRPRRGRDLRRRGERDARASRRCPRRPPSACASSPAGRGSGSTWTPRRSRRRPASTSAP